MFLCICMHKKIDKKYQGGQTNKKTERIKHKKIDLFIKHSGPNTEWSIYYRNIQSEISKEQRVN